VRGVRTGSKNCLKKRIDLAERLYELNRYRGKVKLGGGLNILRHEIEGEFSRQWGPKVTKHSRAKRELRK